jgi:tRNA(fMet)-specific endonuclease VapC
MKYLLDTDVCVFALRGDESVRAQIDLIGPEGIAISVVSLAELRYGASCSDRPEANQRVVDGFAGGIAVLGLDDRIARLFGEFKAQLRKQGSLIDDFDLLIGATACSYRLTLVTHNTEHFGRLPDLQIADWVPI